MIMDWIQFFGILVPLIGLFGFLYKELKSWREDTRNEMKSWREDTKNEINSIREEVRLQSSRSDRLYEMFIALLKDFKHSKNAE